VKVREETVLADDQAPAGNLAGESSIQRLSDGDLRKESKRRRLTTTALSATCSILSMVAALWFQSSLPGAVSLLAVIVIFGANISLVLYLFRWMAIPAKEAARRRKNSVLQMLSATGTER
jgi:hypothetical protein